MFVFPKSEHISCIQTRLDFERGPRRTVFTAMPQDRIWMLPAQFKPLFRAHSRVYHHLIVRALRNRFERVGILFVFFDFDARRCSSSSLDPGKIYSPSPIIRVQ